MLDTNQIVTIIQQTGGTISTLISQVAYFFAIQQAAAWLSFTFPCLLLFSVLLKIAKTQKALGDVDKTGYTALFAWLLFSVALYTGVRGMAHVAQAAFSPAIYVASEIGGIDALLRSVEKK